MRTVIGLLLLAALLLGLGSAEGWNLLHALAYSVLLTIGLAYLWTWSSLRAIYVRPRPRLLRSEVGSHLEERAELENLSWLPKPWLEVIDAADHPQHNLSQVISLGPLARRVRVVRTLCRQRGEFTLGPVALAAADPFGLFRRERTVSPVAALIVLPATVELPAFGRLPGELPGGSLQGERVHFTTPNVATIRDYQPGDSYNRVHWRSTARLGWWSRSSSETRSPISGWRSTSIGWSRPGADRNRPRSTPSPPPPRWHATSYSATAPSG